MRYISNIPDEHDALPFPRRLALMGCTGSIGTSTLRVLKAWKDAHKFQIQALAAGHNITLLAEQASYWRPPYLGILEKDGVYGVNALRSLLPADYHPVIVCGPEGYAQLASLNDVDMVLSAQVGAAGLRATLAAASSGKNICLANKESLVLAGTLIRELCTRTGAVVLPVDSEHCALFEGMVGRKEHEISRLVLTASGGPFRTCDTAFLSTVRPQDALKHPNWNMGAKITIDSATLMNKGLEVIEACHLYQMPMDHVDVVIHPQSLIHSLVELTDGSMMGHFAVPDMRVPIAACLSWPYLLDGHVTGIQPLHLAAAGTLTFEEPRIDDFPCLQLARQAFLCGHTVELNAANEVAVARFLKENIGFTDIPKLVEELLAQCDSSVDFSLTDDLQASVKCILEQLEDIDAATRRKAELWHQRRFQ
jgi:1-deoxy-D-xylulose-5-phosphate reductoisomerase